MTVKRLILHWTAGGNIPNNTDKEHYHYLFDGLGVLSAGKCKPEDNLDCTDGKYAAHTGGMNTGSIGVALCGMLGYVSPHKIGNYPLTRVQCEAAFKFCAGLCKKYNIPIDKEHVKTHWEVGMELPMSSSAGKIDISFLPFEPNLAPAQVGDYIRSKIKWYYSKL